MCPSPPRAPRPYQLEYAPDAWKGLSLLSSEEFSRVQRALQALPEPAAPMLEPWVLHVATLRVRYRLEPAKDTLLLLEVTRLPAEGDNRP